MISKYKSTFTEELFKVAKVINGDPNVYKLQDFEDELIIAKFYEEELSGIDKKDDVYKV